MKRTIISLSVGLLVGAGIATWYFRGHGANGPTTTPHGPVNRVEAAPPSAPPGTVKLDLIQQATIAIAVANPASRDLPAEIKGFGRVLDVAPLIGALADIETAQAALDASRKEYERTEALFARDQNSSARAVESAAAAMKRDQVQLDSARAKLLAQWGKPLVERHDLPALVHSLISLDAVLVRIDVALSEPVFTPPSGARVVSLANESRSVDAEFLGFATVTDAQVQGQGFLFFIKPNALALRPDMAVIGYLKLAGEPVHGVVVPSSAVVREAGDGWVYVQKDQTTFVRKTIPLDHRIDDGWFINEALQPADRIVTAGAQVLLAEEQKAKIKLAD